MKSTKLGRKSASLLVVGGLLLGGGCIPNNFWATTWGGALNTVVGTTVGAVTDVYVTSQLLGYLGVDDENDE